MANPRHVAKLKEGIEAWNAWRAENPKLKIKLEGLILPETNFYGANFKNANLRGAKFFGADLREVNFDNADLRESNLSTANLYSSTLSGTDLRLAHLVHANLTRANLRHANLTSAMLHETQVCYADLSYGNLSSANLSGAIISSTALKNVNLAGAHFGRTSLSDVDLSTASGLETTTHFGPSSIGIDTIYKSNGKIPISFLRDCGVLQELIDYIPSFIGALQPFQLYSAFISYSSKDEEFAERLHADLQSKKVRCWFAPEDLKIGDKFRTTIDEVIRVYDKLLLVLSENSVGSDWVEKEVETAMEKERQQKRTMLFPIRLDDAVMKIETGWPADVRRTRHIGDFQNWKDHDSYLKAFNRLMRDLKADDKVRP